MVAHSWIERAFPCLPHSGYRVSSESSIEYNCVAYAAGKETEWWSHLPDYYWPAPRSEFVESLIAVFTSLGFEVCDNDKQEEGFQRVAIYAKDCHWTHVAKQSGPRWKSKLGPDEDIEHETLDGLAGESYGNVYCIMRKREVEEKLAEFQVSNRERRKAKESKPV